MNDIHRKRIIGKRFRLRRSHLRIRSRVRGTAERPRLCVHKSLRYLYAQVIDDISGRTLVSASSLEPELRVALAGKTGNKEAAKRIGAVVAERAKAAGVTQVVFDRGGYIFHGRVKELADAARAAGLAF